MIKNKAGQKVRVMLNVLGMENNLTAKISKDYGPFVATDDVNPSTIPGLAGCYEFSLTKEETNANNICIRYEHAATMTYGTIEYDTTPETDLLVKLIKKGVNKASYNKETGVMTVYDDDGVTALFTMTTTVVNNIETRERTDA